MAELGRKTKLTKKVRDTICAFLRGGNTRRAAAVAAGVSESVFYDWLKKGEAEQLEQAGRQPSLFVEFLEAVTRAEAEAEVLMVDSIRMAARPHEIIEIDILTMPDGTTRKVEKRKRVHRPEMAIEWLKRRRRDQWGDSLDIRKLDDETLLRMIELGRNKKSDD